MPKKATSSTTQSAFKYRFVRESCQSCSVRPVFVSTFINDALSEFNEMIEPRHCTAPWDLSPIFCKRRISRPVSRSISARILGPKLCSIAHNVPFTVGDSVFTCSFNVNSSIRRKTFIDGNSNSKICPSPQSAAYTLFPYRTVS